MKIPVLFPKIFDYPFTYKSEISESLKSGDFVKAPFGNTELTGVVWPKEQKTEKDYLSLILEGFKSITIYDNTDHEKSIFSNLSKNMGIVLSLNTVITTKIAAKSILLSISND